MKILDRHIGRAVLANVLLVLLALTALGLVISLLEELDDLGEGNYGLPQIIAYILLRIPFLLYELFPAAALIGALLGLGTLANQNELVIMRMAGVSLHRIVASVWRTGGVLIFGALLVGEGIAPHLEQAAHRLRLTAKSEQTTLNSAYGFWARDGQFFINIRKVLPDGRLQDIYIYELDRQHQLHSSTHVSSAFFSAGTWHLENIQQSFIAQNKVRTEAHENTTRTTLLDPQLLNILGIKPNNLSLYGLYQYIHFLRDNQLSSHRYEIAFWDKIIAPGTTFTMLLIAIPFLLGPLRGVHIGQRVLVGTLVGVGFTLLNQSFLNLAMVYELPPWFGAAFPTLLVFTGGVWFLHRMR